MLHTTQDHVKLCCVGCDLYISIMYSVSNSEVSLTTSRIYPTVDPRFHFITYHVILKSIPFLLKELYIIYK